MNPSTQTPNNIAREMELAPEEIVRRNNSVFALTPHSVFPFIHPLKIERSLAHERRFAMPVSLMNSQYSLIKLIGRVHACIQEESCK